MMQKEAIMIVVMGTRMAATDAVAQRMIGFRMEAAGAKDLIHTSRPVGAWMQMQLARMEQITVMAMLQ
mgnify:CR=1 FL=1